MTRKTKQAVILTTFPEGTVMRELEVKRKELSEVFSFLSTNKRCDAATRATASAFGALLDKAYWGACAKIGESRHKASKISSDAISSIEKTIEKEARSLIAYELERNTEKFGKASMGLEVAPLDKPELGWVPGAVKKLSQNFEAYLKNRVGKTDPAKSPLTTTGLKKVFAVVLGDLDTLNGMKWLLDYDGVRFPQDSERLLKARKISKALSGVRGDGRKSTIERLSQELDVTEDTVKEIHRELAYAAYDGCGWEGVIEEDPDFRLDMRKAPKSLRDDIRKFIYAIRARQLDEGNCLLATKTFLDFPAQSDIDEIADSYGLPRGNVEAKVIAMVELMKETVRLRKESMDAHPVRAISWFKQKKGRITEWESKEIVNNTPPGKLEQVRRHQLEYDLLYEEAAYLYELQRAKLIEFINIYGEGLDKEYRAMVAELAGFDPKTGDPLIPSEKDAERFFENLEKTIHRWNDLGKEFRKVPYRLEGALKRRTKAEPEASGTAALVLDDIDGRLEEIRRVTMRAQEKYRKAMEFREQHLGHAIPTARQKKP